MISKLNQLLILILQVVTIDIIQEGVSAQVELPGLKERMVFVVITRLKVDELVVEAAGGELRSTVDAAVALNIPENSYDGDGATLQMQASLDIC